MNQGPKNEDRLWFLSNLLSYFTDVLMRIQNISASWISIDSC